MARGRRTAKQVNPAGQPTQLTAGSTPGAMQGTQVSGMPYGMNDPMTQLARANPMPSSPPSPGGGGGAQTPPLPTSPLPDPFGAKTRIDEPGDAGLSSPLPEETPIEAEELIRLMYAARPSPWLARLLDASG